MGKRENEQLGAYLADRIRGEQTTRLPHHPEAAELASVADAAAMGYEYLDTEGDPVGSRYGLMRYIERDASLWEERQRRRTWAFSFATATACTVVFAGLVLGAFLFGMRQGTLTASRAGGSKSVPYNVTQPNDDGGIKDTPSPDGAPGPVFVENVAAGFGNMKSAMESKFADCRAMAIANGTDEAEADRQIDCLRSALKDLGFARDENDRNRRLGSLSVVVERLSRMDEDYAKNELTVLGLMWAAEIAREEMGELSDAEELYADAGRLCHDILENRERKGLDQAYLQTVRDDASYKYGTVKNMRERSAWADPSAGDREPSSGNPSP